MGRQRWNSGQRPRRHLRHLALRDQRRGVDVHHRTAIHGRCLDAWGGGLRQATEVVVVAVVGPVLGSTPLS